MIQSHHRPRVFGPAGGFSEVLPFDALIEPSVSLASERWSWSGATRNDALEHDIDNTRGGGFGENSGDILESD
jgi:hypothetical protein